MMTELKKKYPKEVIERGEGYQSSVRYCVKINGILYGKVDGSRTYRTEVDIDSLDGNCSCPYGSNCKHAVALFLTYKKGKFNDAGEFIESLNHMSKNELIDLIISKLQDNPDLIVKHNLRKNVKIENFVKEFRTRISPEKIEEANAILQLLSFKQLLELHDYIDKNYEVLSEKISEQEEYNDNYEYWENEEYDAGLYELTEKIKQLLVKKAIKENRVSDAIKRKSLHNEIIECAEDFAGFKSYIKKNFSRENYLRFLLSIKNTNVKEILQYIGKETRHILYEFLPEKVSFIKSIGENNGDNIILFIAAVYEKNALFLFNNFDYFDKARQECPEINEKLDEIARLFIKHKLHDESIAKKLLEQDKNANYEYMQLRYLVSQINDFEFIQNSLNPDKLQMHIALLDRLFDIDKEKTLVFIKNKKDILRRHWPNVLMIFRFLKRHYDKETIKKYIESNRECFTSSHLKNHLKDEGIFIQFTKGKLIVGIR